MMDRCADLDEFFDGELAADQADRFRDHLADCERCQEILHGRMQENVAAQVPAARRERAAAPAATALAEAPAPVVSAAAVPAPACAAAPGGPARTRIFRRAVAYASPLLAAAAAYALWFGDCSDPGLEMAVAVDRAPGTDRSDRAAAPSHTITVHAGEVLRPTVRGPRHRAIWVYAGERSLVAACPGAARCRDDGGELTLEFTLTAPGKYAIVALGSSDLLPAPGTTLDQTRVAARRAGIRTVLQYVEVE
jgi:hypothetical protein